MNKIAKLKINGDTSVCILINKIQLKYYIVPIYSRYYRSQTGTDNKSSFQCDCVKIGVIVQIVFLLGKG